MIVAIHQPHYLPWLRYMHKIASCDVFVLLDDTQYEKSGWQNRSRIKGPQGPVLLTVPVREASFKPICEVMISNHNPWRDKHWKSIVNFYRNAPFFTHYAEIFERAYTTEWELLTRVNEYFLRALCKAFGVRTPIVSSSSLGVPGKGSERLVSICQHFGARQYLTGAYAAQNHLDLNLFASTGIEVLVQTRKCPSYEQQYPELGFVSELSAVDLLLNEGARGLSILLREPADLQVASVT